MMIRMVLKPGREEWRCLKREDGMRERGETVVSSGKKKNSRVVS